MGLAGLLFLPAQENYYTPAKGFLYFKLNESVLY